MKLRIRKRVFAAGLLGIVLFLCNPVMFLAGKYVFAAAFLDTSEILLPANFLALPADFIPDLPQQPDPHQFNDTTIPRIIHQTWRTADMSTLKSNWAWAHRSCHERHDRDFTYMFWTDADLLDFVQRHYADFVPKFLSFPHPIQQIDAARILLLHFYGGIYMDMDIGCERSMLPLISVSGARGVLPQTMGGLSNDWMAFEPKHPFLEAIIRNMHSTRTFMPYLTVMLTTGPAFVTSQFYWSDSETRDGIRILPGRFYADRVPEVFFNHVNGSTWHEADAIFVRWVIGHGIYALLVAVALAILIFMKRKQRKEYSIKIA
ncbi:hypothetical protein HK100_012353 [Physocladia obscura]|uniref:Uncharacterized protein n=1 Tax=Physocladia obscura TaxID=109957 RepID=A0AAD5T1M3_9FUNG|nr:hypothetical protein HK100_012353 [Physocladia obscura]